MRVPKWLKGFVDFSSPQHGHYLQSSDVLAGRPEQPTMIPSISVPEIKENKTTIEVYRDKKGDHRWRYKAANGEIIAVSSEGYSSRQALNKALKIMTADFSTAKIIV